MIFSKSIAILPAVSVAFALVAGCQAPAAHAQTLELLVLPASSSPPPLTSGQNYTLPGYGQVKVTWVPSNTGGVSPTVVSAPFVALNNATLALSPAASLGANVRLMGFYPDSSPRQYKVTFTFLENNAPDLTRLQLIVNNLGISSGGAKTTISSTTPLVLGGNFVYPASPTPLTMVGSVIQSSNNSYNPTNTGVANFRIAPSVTSLPMTGGSSTLTLDVVQLYNDQIAMSLAYRQLPPPPAALKVCKVAGDGVPVGSKVNFTVAGPTPSSFSIPAGPAPGGYCHLVGTTFPQGTTIGVTEQVPPGQFVSDIGLNHPFPGKDGIVTAYDKAAGRVEMKLYGLTEITFTNTRYIKPDQVGYVEICKSGGNVASASFRVTGASTTTSTPVGSCSAPIRIAVPADDKVTISEIGPGNPAGCTTYPEDRLIGFDAATGNCVVTVKRGNISSQTVVNFVNR